MEKSQNLSLVSLQRRFCEVSISFMASLINNSKTSKNIAKILFDNYFPFSNKTLSKRFQNKNELLYEINEIITTEYFIKISYNVHHFLYPNDIVKFNVNFHYFSQFKCHLFTEVFKLKAGERKYEVSDIIISQKFEIIVNTIRNFKLFQSIAPLLCDRVEVTSGSLDVGDLVTFFYNNDKFHFTFKVIELIKEEYHFIMKLSFDGNSQRTPPQKIIWKVTKITENQFTVSIEHLFEKPVQEEYLKALSKNKVKILTSLKSFCESFKAN